MFDLAIDFAEDEPRLDLSAAERIRAIAVEEGAEAKVSSIHVNVWLGKYDKLEMTSLFLSSRFGLSPIEYPTCVAFAGDSPNDEPMFAAFPLSCGVANIGRFIEGIKNKPGYIASKRYLTIF
jgi:hydroxymethylpyrimidine pyrophosphatase-like HAD family hydrolase